MSLQQQHRKPPTLLISQQFLHNSSSQVGGSSELPVKHLFQWWSRAFKGSPKKGKVGVNIPYFPVVLGFAATGCLGAGLLVVFADPREGGSTAPSPANATLGIITYPTSSSRTCHIIATHISKRKCPTFNSKPCVDK